MPPLSSHNPEHTERHRGNSHQDGHGLTEASPRRTATAADRTRANATPKSDIEIRIPTPKTAISISRLDNGAASSWPPNGTSIVKALRLLRANAAPTMVGRWECWIGIG